MGSPNIESIKKAKKKQKQQALQEQVLGKIKEVFIQSPIKSTLMLSLILGVLACSGLGVFAWQNFVVKERNRQMETFAEQTSRLAASNVANYLHGIEKRLAFFTNSSSLNTAFKYNDKVGRLEIENALKNSFPEAVHIRMFAKDEAKIDLDGDPPLRFSELDLIKQAEQRERVIPEAIKLGQSDWRFNVVVPVPENPEKPVLGTIMVTLPMSDLYKHLRENVEDLGKVSLYQSFDGKQRLMGSFGKGDQFKTSPISVPDSRWQVEFVASKRLFEQTEIEVTLVVMVVVIACLSVLAAFLIVGLAIGRKIHKRQMALQETERVMGATAAAGGNRDGLNVSVSKEDEGLLGLGDEVPTGEGDSEALDIDDPFDIEAAIDEAMAEDDDPSIPSHIFRSYDIRGIYEKEINNDFAYKVGQALGTEALEIGEKSMIVGRDARTHSPILTENLIRGILSTGCSVINIGTVPTPLVYFAVEKIDGTQSGVVVTASHNPAQYNGFKVVMGGKVRTAEDIKAVRARMIKGNFRTGIGKESQREIVADYIETIFSDVALAGDLHVVIDAGSGVTGRVAPELFEELGCTVTPLHCDLDGSFPHHDPDPSREENLQDLIKKVQSVDANLGVAFDGDGDRVTVVTPTGKIIWPDRLLMLFAKDILARNPGGDVVFDVKSSRLLNSVVSSNGGRPIMWKTGHAPMRAKMVETGALVGGEFSGHIFIKDRWYGFDDGMYAAARLIEILSLRDESVDEVFEEFPSLIITQEYRFPVEEEEKFILLERLKDEGDFGDAKVISIDGIRAEFPYGWGLARASNTSAAISMRFEAETDEQIHNLKSLFTRELRKINKNLEIKW